MACWELPLAGFKVWVTMVLIGVGMHSANAEQLSFTRKQNASGLTFSYQWRDTNQQTQSITFALPQDSIADLPTEQSNYQPALAQRYVTVELLKTARTVDPRQANIQIRQRGGDIDIDIRSREPARIAGLRAMFSEARETAFNDYLYRHYYMRYATSLNQQAIKPDHMRYVGLFTRALIPLSQAFYDQLQQNSDARDYFDLLLGWVQSIPYDPLTDRISSNGSGFVPPLTLIMQNKGDCDSKSVLTASIARAFLPKTPMALVLLRDHALLGIAVSQTPSDTTLMINDIPHVLFEPTGPALLAFGQVSSSTQRELSSGQYTIEVIPATH